MAFHKKPSNLLKLESRINVCRDPFVEKQKHINHGDEALDEGPQGAQGAGHEEEGHEGPQGHEEVNECLALVDLRPAMKQPICAPRGRSSGRGGGMCFW